MPDALCKDIDGRARGGGHALSGLTVLVAAAACVLSLAPASAQAPERIRETCRELTRPQIQSCMQERKGAGDREKNREAIGQVAERLGALVDQSPRETADRSFEGESPAAALLVFPPLLLIVAGAYAAYVNATSAVSALVALAAVGAGNRRIL